MKRKRNQGRRYEVEEWLEFEMDGNAEGEAQESGLEVDDIQNAIDYDDKDLVKAKEKFETEANRVVEAWLDKHEDAREVLDKAGRDSYYDIAWYTYADYVGHGVGFWEDLDDKQWKSLEKVLKDKKLQRSAVALETAMQDALGDAVEKVRGTESNPNELKKRVMR